jgi:hypothetical protein
VFDYGKSIFLNQYGAAQMSNKEQKGNKETKKKPAMSKKEKKAAKQAKKESKAFLGSDKPA